MIGSDNREDRLLVVTSSIFLCCLVAVGLGAFALGHFILSDPEPHDQTCRLVDDEGGRSPGAVDLVRPVRDPVVQDRVGAQDQVEAAGNSCVVALSSAPRSSFGPIEVFIDDRKRVAADLNSAGELIVDAPGLPERMIISFGPALEIQLHDIRSARVSVELPDIEIIHLKALGVPNEVSWGFSGQPSWPGGTYRLLAHSTDSSGYTWGQYSQYLSVSGAESGVLIVKGFGVDRLNQVAEVSFASVRGMPVNVEAHSSDLLFAPRRIELEAPAKGVFWVDGYQERLHCTGDFRVGDSISVWGEGQEGAVAFELVHDVDKQTTQLDIGLNEKKIQEWRMDGVKRTAHWFPRNGGVEQVPVNISSSGGASVAFTGVTGFVPPRVFQLHGVGEVRSVSVLHGDGVRTAVEDAAAAMPPWFDMVKRREAEIVVTTTDERPEAIVVIGNRGFRIEDRHGRSKFALSAHRIRPGVLTGRSFDLWELSLMIGDVPVPLESGRGDVDDLLDRTFDVNLGLRYRLWTFHDGQVQITQGGVF